MLRERVFLFRGAAMFRFLALALLLAAWDGCPGCPEDLDGDGVVGAGDLALLLADWG